VQRAPVLTRRDRFVGGVGARPRGVDIQGHDGVDRLADCLDTGQEMIEGRTTGYFAAGDGGGQFGGR